MRGNREGGGERREEGEGRRGMEGRGGKEGEGRRGREEGRERGRGGGCCISELVPKEESGKGRNMFGAKTWTMP